MNIRIKARQAVTQRLKSRLTALLGLLLLVPVIQASGENPAGVQERFADPDLAVQALVRALADRNMHKLKDLFGERASDLLPLSRVRPETIDTFIEKYTRSYTFLSEGTRQYLLAVGEEGWTFPVPIALGNDGWSFDTEEGIERVRIRRIGRNELAVMQASLAFYDAQKEYVVQDRDGDSVKAYAQKLKSSEGARDGLYWKTAPGEEPSPLGPRFANESPEAAYFGYHYRILDAQGEYATGGRRSYIEDGKMVGGFGLLAWPVEYGDTGVMTFMVNQQGVVYATDLGADTASIAPAIQSFDPGPDWAPELSVANK